MTQQKPTTGWVVCPNCATRRMGNQLFCARCGFRFSRPAPPIDGAWPWPRFPLWWVIGIAVVLFLAVSSAPSIAAVIPPNFLTNLAHWRPSAQPTSQSQSFVVPPNGSFTITLSSVTAGEIIEGSFETSGGGGDIDFQLKAPNGAVLDRDTRNAGSHAFRVVADQNGYYALWFGNSSTPVISKTVTLSSRVHAPDR